MAYEYPLGINGDGTDENMPRSRIVFYAKEVENVDFKHTTVDFWEGIPFASVGKALTSAALPNVRETVNQGSPNDVANQTKAFQGAANSVGDNLVRKPELGSNYITKTKVDNKAKQCGVEQEAVFLYTPVAIQVDDRFSYNNAELGISGAAGLNAIQNSNNLGAAAYAAVGNAVAGISDFKNFVTGGQLSNLAAVRASQGVFGINPIPEKIQNAIGLAAQITVNPNLRTLFKGVQVRSFSFQFQFLPSSPAEAQSVEDIVQFFRYYAHPDTQINGGSLGTFGYKFPDRFEIDIEHFDGSSWYPINPKFLESYLTNVSITYNPTASVYFDDGKPVQTNMTLSFMEYRALDKTDLITPEYDAGVSVTLSSNGSQVSPNLTEADKRSPF